jgi:hypothetical protein
MKKRAPTSVSLKRAARELWDRLGGRRPSFLYERDPSTGKVVAATSRNWFVGHPEQEPEEAYDGRTGSDLRIPLHDLLDAGVIDERTRMRATWVLVNRVKRGTDKAGRDHETRQAPEAAYHATFWYLTDNIDLFTISVDQRLAAILAQGGIVKWLRFDLFRPSRGYTMSNTGKVTKESHSPLAEAKRLKREKRREKERERAEEDRARIVTETRARLEAEARAKLKAEEEAKKRDEEEAERTALAAAVERIAELERELAETRRKEEAKKKRGPSPKEREEAARERKNARARARRAEARRLEEERAAAAATRRQARAEKKRRLEEEEARRRRRAATKRKKNAPKPAAPSKVKPKPSKARSKAKTKATTKKSAPKKKNAKKSTKKRK